MTRINLGINPRDLSNKHLLAEHREIKRIPNMIKSGKAKIENIPNQFTLGAGHVKFFYNKIKHLRIRYQEIYNECCKRGFSVTPYHESFDDVPEFLNKDYQPTENDRKIIIERLLQKDKEFYKKIKP